MLEAHIYTLDENVKVLREFKQDNNYENIYDQVQMIGGKSMVKEYMETLTSFNLLKTREAFITLIQNGHMDRILPHILRSEDNR